MAGTLFVVATPIGNLSDLSRRAEQTLRDADCVAAEDTRRTRALLTHFGIEGKTVVKLDANATDRAIESVVLRLSAGETVALVTDAGTPSVSDPGTALVRRAALENVPVVAIPGPSAVTAAVSASGLVEGPFSFLGFASRHGEKRRRFVRRVRDAEEPVVFFEAPARVRRTLADLAEAMPDRAACVVRELTKIHEEVLRGTLSELASRKFEERGEFTVVVAGTDPALAPEASDLDVDRFIGERLDAGDPPRTVADALASVLGSPRREIYAKVLAAVRARG